LVDRRIGKILADKTTLEIIFAKVGEIHVLDVVVRVTLHYNPNRAKGYRILKFAWNLIVKMVI